MAGGLLLFPVAGPLAADPGAMSVQVLAINQVGQLVTVTVFLPGDGTQVGKVAVHVATSEGPTFVTQAFAVQGGRRAHIQVAVPQGGRVLRAGVIVDDGTPF